MKRWLLWTLMCLVVSGVSQAQVTQDASITDTSDRTFFPHDWFWGYTQFDLAPPHNEIDPNLCAGNAKAYGGECSVQRIRALHAIRIFGSAAVWERATPQVHAFRAAVVSVWEECPAGALHLVV